MTTRARTALITGASRGLGLALARSLAADGWTLVIDGRDAITLSRAAAELSPLTDVIAVAGDVTDEAHRTELADVVAELGGADLVVHNAGTLGPSPLPSVDALPRGTLLDVFTVNVVAPVRLTQLVLPWLRPGAVIVAVTSDAAVEGYEGWGAYGASKAALEQIFNVFGAEHPELRVLRIDPGDMRTQMQQDAFPGEDISDRPLPEASVPGIRHLIDSDQPSGRYAARSSTPAEVS